MGQAILSALEEVASPAVSLHSLVMNGAEQKGQLENKEFVDG